MLDSLSNPKIFLSFAAPDRIWADKMRDILQAQGAEVVVPDSSIRTGEPLVESLRCQLSGVTAVFVLIGARTRSSKWVDMEVEMATYTTSGQAPGMVAVILPDHEDYSRPFYDPENVPLRIHEHVSRETALLRKWPKQPDEVLGWITDAVERRRRFPMPFVNFATLSALNSFGWDESVDQPN